jgi:hypothetical protein
MPPCTDGGAVEYVHGGEAPGLMSGVGTNVWFLCKSPC